MKRIHLLDCTLRDGGFVNNWKFGEDCIINIYERLELAGIDIIEVGYLRDYVPFDMDESQYPDTASVGKVIPPKIDKKSKVVGIIDYGDCALENIGPCSQSVLDGIRVTFKRRQLDEAVEFCRQIKEKGYFISLQPVSFMDYTPDDVLRLVHAVNKIDPFAVCIVDTYGFMNKRDLLRYFSLMDATLNSDIILGYHSHNNFQLAYSNAIELIEQFTERGMIIDCSVMGMGKGAGNAPTELIAQYINSNLGGHYDVSQILEIADTYIEKELGNSRWGYSLKYYLAASNYCHHKYVTYLLDKKTLSIKSVNEILERIEPDKKTSYDEKHIAQLYGEYQEKCIDDGVALDSLKQLISNRPVLILAPGSSLREEEKSISAFIQANRPYIISVNLLPLQYQPDAVFVSNHKRYGQIALRAKKYPSEAVFIATSNINPTTLHVGIRLNYSSLIVDDESIRDNATLMLINGLVRIGVSEVSIAGFDGFVQGKNNYLDKSLEFQGEPWKNNQAIKEAVTRLEKHIHMHFLTKSKYI